MDLIWIGEGDCGFGIDWGGRQCVWSSLGRETVSLVVNREGDSGFGLD